MEEVVRSTRTFSFRSSSTSIPASLNAFCTSTRKQQSSEATSEGVNQAQRKAGTLTGDLLEKLRARAVRGGTDPHDVSPLLVASPELHDVHAVQRHAQLLACEELHDFGLYVLQHLDRRFDGALGLGVGL